MKKFKSLLGIGILIFSLAGCAGEYDPDQQIGHTHTYSSDWSYDEEYHWHQATCEHKDKVSEKAKHSFVMREIEPTYEADGVKTYTCSVCGYSYSEKGKNKLEHNYSSSYSHDNDHHWRACTDEGYEDLYIDYGEHSFSDTRVEPTYDTKGSVTHTCSCGYSYTEELDVLTHHYSDDWSTDGTYHWHACTDEGYEDLYTEKARHTYSDYVYKTYPTDTTPGTKERYCTVCECVEKVSFDAISSSAYTVTEYDDYCTIYSSVHYISDEVIYIPSHVNGKPVKVISGFWLAHSKAVLIPDTVETIQAGAFYGCSSLESVYIPASVKEILIDEGSYAGYMFSGSKANFYVDKANLNFVSDNGSLYTKDYKTLLIAGYSTNLSIQEGTEYIGGYAISIAGKHLKTVSIPSSLKEIGEGAFAGCSELKEVTVFEGVQSIGDKAFSGCYKLTAISLPSSVKSIGNSAFSGCGFKQFSIPSGVESIGEQILYNTPVETIVVDSSNKNFVAENNVLYTKDYSRLLVVAPSYSGGFVVREEVISIDSNAFYNCTAITSLTIGKNVTDLREAGFDSCKALETVNWNVINGDNKFNKNFVKNVNFGKDVKYLPAGLLNGEINVTLYDSFEYDITDMFGECTIKNLNNVDGLNYIGNKEEPYLVLVSADKDITTATIKDGCKYVLSKAFKDITSLVSTVIPSSMKKVGQYAYSGCTSLNSVTINEGLTIVSTSMFSGCTSLSSIILPDSLLRIESKAFYNCSFTQLTLPVNLTYLSGEAIAWCPSLKTLYWNSRDLQTQIFGDAYKPTTQLTKVVFGETVEVIHSNSFSSSTTLSTLEFSNGESILTIEEGAFYGLYNCLSTIVFGSSVNTICKYGFESCKLSSVVLAEGVERLESQAFYKCADMTSVTLPKSLKFIGSGVFHGEYISSLTYLGTIAEWEQIEKEGNIIARKNKDHYYLACSDGNVEIF